MSKSKRNRKPRPAQPHWFWLNADGCWWCDHRNGCNGCNVLNQEQRKRNRKQERDEKQRIKNRDYETL